MKKISAFLLAVVLVLCCVAGCGKQSNTSDEKTIKVLYEGWVNGAVPLDYESNPYKKLIDETYGVDWQLSLTSDMNNEILKRFSSSHGDKPDVIIFTDVNKLKSLYNQGFLVEDYTPYLDAMPNISGFYTENRDQIGSIYTDDGKLMCVMYPRDTFAFNFRIRSDWVQEWNTAKGTVGNPKTTDDLLDMARWVKQTKGSDYYLFTSAGENTDLGQIKNLIYMFSEHDSWYVTDDGQLSHPILDGSHKEFLDFMKTVVSEGLIDPDWYTQSWGNHKTNLFNGKIGIDWHSPAIALEYAEGTTQAQKSGIWTNLEMPTNDENVVRQGMNFSRIGGYKIVINKNCSEEKIRKILTIFNDMMWRETNDIENSLYYQLRWGLTIDGYTIGRTDKENELEKVLDAEGNDTGFYAYYTQVNKDAHAKSKYGSLWDYGVPITSPEDRVIEHGLLQSYNESAYDYIKLFYDTRDYYDRQTTLNYQDMIRNSDPKLVNNVEAMVNEFEINYIQEKNSMSYDEFVQKWLSSGAKQMQSSAEQQLRELGYIQ